MQCGGCAKTSEQISMLCANCTAASIQQKRTMIMALWADVAVLREKASSALDNKDPHCQQNVGAGDEEEEQKRERDQFLQLLDKDRIALAKMKHHIEERQGELKAAKARLENPPAALMEALSDDSGEINYVLDGLSRVARWNEQNLAAIRRTKVLQLFQLIQVIPVSDRSVHFRTIAKLPLPVSGQYDANLPPEVVSAAFGRLIHVLLMLPKYIHPLVYPHPMIFNGSFSTIGQQSGEGAGCHTLYPDGSVGFARAVKMLWQNVAFLCVSQGMDLAALHPVDIVGNLVQLSECPSLGSGAAHKASMDKLQQEIAAEEASGVLPLVDMTTSIRILPQYSPNDATMVRPSVALSQSIMEWNVIEPNAFRPKP
ncbi:Aste57867_14722 [Aphanomyces stellatus]|uniref:Aste57867_14722 protein n=1 Tax=Aphanomyces stellatus TaxID=120398 RepID=A0A485L351_9STRA|nr:hypothetical protein As57867_014667 [Aphanomyces stellatus]VFT91540.1 Aste57867_14722 [Aphanomyces stellatus]